MFFLMPGSLVIIVYLLAALVPALFLMRYIYRHDTVEKEPPRLLVTLALLGVVAALVSIALEYAGEAALSLTLDSSTPAYTIVSAFLVVAAAEEGTKLVVLKLKTWKDPNFNYRFDGIVYAAFVSLGFAAFENLIYVFGYGLSVSVTRAVLAIPGHLAFSVFMGLFYGRARLAANLGNRAGKTLNLIAAYLSAVFLHGLYDSCAMLGTGLAMLIFAAFVIIMYIVTIKLVKNESRTDRPIA